MSRKRTNNDKQDLYKALSIIVSGFTCRIFVYGLRILAILGIIAVIIGLYYLVNRIIELKRRRGRRSKKKCIRIAWISYGILVTGIIIFGCSKIDVIHEKFKEWGKSESEYSEVFINEKGRFGIQPNRLGIMQEVLNNMTTTTGQAQ